MAIPAAILQQFIPFQVLLPESQTPSHADMVTKVGSY